MPNLCHGNGDLTRDGCCFVAGQVCPLRWRVGTDGHVYDAANGDLGTVSDVAQSLGLNKGQANALGQVIQGRTFVCSVAARLIANNPRITKDPVALETAWNSDPDYVAQVRPEWARIEASLGLPEGGYNCATWRGTGGPQCCFAEPADENAAKAANLGDPAGGIGST